MTDHPRIVAAGDSAVVLEFEERIDPDVNARAVQVAEAIQAAGLPGVRDVVPTYRSVAVYFDPLRTEFDALARCLEREAAAARPESAAAGAPVRIPVCYGGTFGPDLGAVAAFAGLGEADVVRLHKQPTYRVFMMGFVPGFTYLGPVNPRIAAPRRPTPRVRVPAGSVGIAGLQTGMYPSETPGGWQLVGRTPVRTFDLSRRDPFLLKAGDAVQFYEVAPADWDRLAGSVAHRPVEPRVPSPVSCRSHMHIIRPGLQTTIQDGGRWGWQSRGVSPAGPMDPCAHRLANALVGNNREAATLEIALRGPEVEFDHEQIVAVAGAVFSIEVDGRAQPMNSPFTVPSGSRLRFGERLLGSRAYLAVAGGIVCAPTLGSRATHLVSAMGGLDGRALAAGDRLPLGDPDVRPGLAPRPPAAARGLSAMPAEGRPTRVRVLPGPQRDYFAADALDTLQSAPYAVHADSDRMGFRLEGPALRHARGADIISDATPLGVLQVPASGQPVLLMADRQTTGGYPKLATVIAADIGLAGQLAPGDRIAFEVCTLREALAALIAQERAMMAIEAAARR